MSSGDSTFEGCINLVGTNVGETYKTTHGSDSRYDSSDYAYVCESEEKPGLFTDYRENPHIGFYGLSQDNKTLYISPTLTDNTKYIEEGIISGFESLDDIPWADKAKEIEEVKV